MNRVIITGAGGFIGYALASRLLDEGVEVYAVVRKQRKQWERLEQRDNCHVVVCNLENMADLDSLITEKGFDAFYHFAWQGVSDNDSTDLKVQLNNVWGTAKAVETAGRLECRKFVFASSIMEYELDKLMQSTLPSGERNIYRAAKKMASAVARICCNAARIEYHSALITNVYGPGEFSDRFVITTLKKMLKGEKLFFSAATQMYDFCYIDDAVSILDLIGRNGKENHSYYVGAAQPRPLKEYILEMRNCVGGESEMDFSGRGEFIGVSLDYDEFDIHSSEKELHYQAGTGFREGIGKTLEWLRDGERVT